MHVFFVQTNFLMKLNQNKASLSKIPVPALVLNYVSLKSNLWVNKCALYLEGPLKTQKIELGKNLSLELTPILPFNTEIMLAFQMDHFAYFSRSLFSFLYYQLLERRFSISKIIKCALIKHFLVFSLFTLFKNQKLNEQFVNPKTLLITWTFKQL